MNKRTVGWEIRARREAVGLSQEELAELIGIRQPYLSRIECGDVARIAPRLARDIERALAEAEKKK